MKDWWADWLPLGAYGLFLHDVPTSGREFLQNPERIYAANRMIADDLRPIRRDVIEAWCPSTLDGNGERAGLNILTFGMAHKFQGPWFERLRSLLADSGKPYTISLSTGIHEGTPWSEGFTENIALMRGIFGDRLRVLGFLGDDALAKELQDCTAVALFYDPALRANNTTAWAALDAGAALITNLDAQSPPDLEHGVTCFDVHQLNTWPTGDALGRFSRAAGRRVAQRYGWDRLVELLTA